MRKKDDTRALKQAEKEAAKLVKYWHEKGFPDVKAYLVPYRIAVGKKSFGTGYGVRLNLDEKGNPK